jgi:hypothetical protein
MTHLLNVGEYFRAFPGKYLTGLVCIIYIFLQACMPQNTSSVEHDEFLFNFTDSTFLTIENAFKKRDVDGCFIIYDVKKDTALTYNTERATQYFSASLDFQDSKFSYCFRMQSC